MVRISEFQIKDVVNVADGKKLGNISDIDINLQELEKLKRLLFQEIVKFLGFSEKMRKLSFLGEIL